HFKTILVLASMLAIKNAFPDNGLPNLSPRLATQPKTIELFADYIYWYTSETVDLSFTLNQNSAFESSFKTFAFGWAPGFRVGLGYNMLHDQWDSQLSYTWFQSKASGHTSGEVTPSFFAARLSALEPFSTGKASIHLQYN